MPVQPSLSALPPHEAAKQVGVGVQSIRRWCEWHAAHLSAGATPGPGIPRKLTGRDIQVLIEVRALRYQGYQTEAINDRLAMLTFAEIDTGEHSEPSQENDLAQRPPGAPESTEIVVRLLDTLAAMQRQIDSIQESGRKDRRDAILWVALGAIGAGVFFVVVLLAALVLGRS